MRVFNWISIDRAIAKSKPGLLVLIALLALLAVPFAFWVTGIVLHWLVEHFFSFMDDWPRDGLLWDTFDSYLNPNGHAGSKFNTRLYYYIAGAAGIFLLDGLMVSMLVSWFEGRKSRWEKGSLHYKERALRRFSVVIGGNEMVPDLVGQLLSSGQLDYVVVMTNRDVSALRKKMVSRLSDMEKRVVIYYGERTAVEDLKYLRLQSVHEEFYIIGEQIDIEQKGSHHDVKNMDCVQKIAGLLEEAKSERKVCRVMFEYQSTFSIFQIADVNKVISTRLDFRPFNYYETWAQKVLVNKNLDHSENDGGYLPLEGREAITKDSKDTVHIVIVGMGRMGVALAVETAHMAHYPNFVTQGRLTRITFIDSEARKGMNYFQGHYRELFALSRWRFMEAKKDSVYYDTDNCFEEAHWHDPRKDDPNSPYKDSKGYTLGEDIVDVEWQFIQGDLEMPAVQRFIRNEAKRKDERMTIAICFPMDNASLAAALYLPYEVYEEKSSVVQVLAYQPYGDAMQKSFMDGQNATKSFKLFSKLRPFGMMDCCYNMEFQKDVELIANEFGEVYTTVSAKMRSGMRNRLNMSITKAGKSLAARRWSSVYNGIHLWTKLRSVNYVEGRQLVGPNEEMTPDVELLSKVEHARWNMEQLLLGFAPLEANEQKEMKRLRDEAKKNKLPKNADDQTTRKWLEGWKEFDEKKEQLKGEMSHLDICSFHVLEDIDYDSIIYDVEMVKILPTLYEKTKGKTT